jgi:hypothetical protein
MAFTWDGPEAPQRLGGADPSTVNAPPGIVPGHVLQTGQVYAGTSGPNTTPYIGTTTADGSVNYQQSPFSKTSTSADLLAALNKAGAAPGSAQATSLTKLYTDALGISGNALQDGFSAGQYDPTRSKIYLPGTDLKYDNGQWGDHPYSATDQPQADALGSLIAPFTEQFTNPAFQPPTSVNDQNDPGFTARMNAADDALQRSAAAKGSLLSGSTLKALSDYNSDYASSEYGKTYDRDLSTYNTNSQNAYQQYAQRRANFYQNQDSPFAKLFGMAQLDSSNQNAFNSNQLGYASLGASTLQNPSYANYLTQGANANAAGQVGAGNAYSGLFGNLGNTATLGYLATRPPTTYPNFLGY